MVCKNRENKKKHKETTAAAARSCSCVVVSFSNLNTFLPVLVENFAQVWGKKSLKWLQRAWSAFAASPRENKKFR